MRRLAIVVVAAAAAGCLADFVCPWPFVRGSKTGSMLTAQQETRNILNRINNMILPHTFDKAHIHHMIAQTKASFPHVRRWSVADTVLL